jgi:hypothetical protein
MPGGAKSVPVRSLIVEGGYYLTATQQLNSSLAWDLTELAQNSISAAYSPAGCSSQSTRIHSLQILFKLKAPFTI